MSPAVQPRDPERNFETPDLESSLFDRTRRWTDLFGWLRLGRTLRVAASPPMLLMVGLALGITSIVDSLTIGELPGTDSPLVDRGKLASHGQVVASHFLRPSPAIDYLENSNRSIWQCLLRSLVWLLVWTPVALLLTRQGALLTADRPMMGLAAGIRHVARLTPQAWIAAWIPTLCVMMIGLMVMFVGAVGRLTAGVDILELAAGWTAALVALPAGVLLFGSLFAIPLAWSAITNEQEHDPLDSLSRGYEYLYRRPIQLVTYCLMSFVLVVLVGVLAWGIANATSLVVASAMAFANAPDGLILSATQLCKQFPTIAMLVTAWSLIGGVYLLIRQSAGGQEVEDLWMPPSPPTPKLPELK